MHHLVQIYLAPPQTYNLQVEKNLTALIAE